MTEKKPAKPTAKTKVSPKSKPRPKLIDVLDDLDWIAFEIIDSSGKANPFGASVRCVPCGEIIKATGPTGHGDIRKHADEHRKADNGEHLGSTLREGETLTVGQHLLRSGAGVVLTPDDIEKALATAESRRETAPGSQAGAKLIAVDSDDLVVTQLPPKADKPKRRASNERPSKGRIPKPTDPWDRQQDEGVAPWEAFVTYRDMGLARSHVKVADELSKSVQLISRWAKAHTWALRVAAYDSMVDREWQLEMKEQRRKSAQRNARIADRALELVAARLEQAFQLDAGDVARLMSEASKLERLALGLSTENLELTGRNGGPIETVDHTLLTDEERNERLLQLRREIDTRLEQDGITA
jgi:hypothetical protein